MPQFVGELLQKNQEGFSNNPSKRSYEASLHAAKLTSAREKLNKPERTEVAGGYTPPSGDDYAIGPSASIDSSEEGMSDTEDTTDFEAGYNSAVGSESILKEKLVSWAAGIFSPPGTGPMFGGTASLMQWIFREETSSTDTTIENEET